MISHEERTRGEYLRKRSWGKEGQVRQRIYWNRSHCSMRGTVWIEKYVISFISYTFVKYDFYPIEEEACQTHVISEIVFLAIPLQVTTVAQWLRELCYKSVGRWLDPSWCQWTDIKSFRSHYGPGVDSASNRNEYQEYFLGVKSAGA